MGVSRRVPLPEPPRRLSSGAAAFVGGLRAGPAAAELLMGAFGVTYGGAVGVSGETSGVARPDSVAGSGRAGL
ncbi:hypothetical protein LNKW23_47570 [Paralimibaculum aggregatum]|uniref:Uncharacterized protein n=1 Tax=Paralimibaculum aggregatum TaxID=3036245 RepID=A0ABQ6LTX9_9RHOB|nr:hypothetical protein LNKW23_47570 [Limibaculum sp. NKW23]